MATAAEPLAAGAGPVVTTDARPRRYSGGWRIVASKELGDHVRSIRFILLVVIVGLAGMAAVNPVADAIRDQAESASQIPSFFLLLFTESPQRVPAFFDLVAFLGPLLGIAFGFDALSSERSQRTLPRLVSQPIHRDDVILGKFVAGMAAISLALFVFVTVVSGYGIVRLGLVPGWSAFARLLAYLVVALAYIGFWLALSILLSTVLRRGATAALASIAIWLVFTLFWSLITGVVADTV
jgi:ABC-2 type transport system permease protein